MPPTAVERQKLLARVTKHYQEASPSTKRDMQDMFNTMNEGTGRQVTKAQLERQLNKRGSVSTSQLNSLWKLFDMDGSQGIDMYEMLAMFAAGATDLWCDGCSNVILSAEVLMCPLCLEAYLELPRSDRLTKGSMVVSYCSSCRPAQMRCGHGLVLVQNEFGNPFHEWSLSRALQYRTCSCCLEQHKVMGAYLQGGAHHIELYESEWLCEWCSKWSCNRCGEMSQCLLKPYVGQWSFNLVHTNTCKDTGPYIWTQTALAKLAAKEDRDQCLTCQQELLDETLSYRTCSCCLESHRVMNCYLPNDGGANHVTLFNGQWLCERCVVWTCNRCGNSSEDSDRPMLGKWSMKNYYHPKCEDKENKNCFVQNSYLVNKAAAYRMQCKTCQPRMKAGTMYRRDQQASSTVSSNSGGSTITAASGGSTASRVANTASSGGNTAVQALKEGRMVVAGANFGMDLVNFFSNFS